MNRRLPLAIAVAFLSFQPLAFADMSAANRWIDKEFQPSALSKSDQKKEMEWFVKAAAPFKGMEINVLSETIPTHEYESKTLTKAFEEITGIKVNHQLLGEGEVVQAVQTQMQTGRNLYDAYINDSDLIGTHSRLQLAVNLSDWMAGEGKSVTNPMLDIDDFIGASGHFYPPFIWVPLGLPHNRSPHENRSMFSLLPSARQGCRRLGRIPPFIKKYLGGTHLLSFGKVFYSPSPECPAACRGEASLFNLTLA